MGGAAELKLILALAHTQLGSAGRVGTSAKRAKPDFNTFERCCRNLLRDLDEAAREAEGRWLGR